MAFGLYSACNLRVSSRSAALAASLLACGAAASRAQRSRRTLPSAAQRAQIVHKASAGHLDDANCCCQMHATTQVRKNCVRAKSPLAVVSTSKRWDLELLLCPISVVFQGSGEVLDAALLRVAKGEAVIDGCPRVPIW
eukprot:5303079-Amphidinium_carterae.1